MTFAIYFTLGGKLHLNNGTKSNAMFSSNLVVLYGVSFNSFFFIEHAKYNFF